MTAVGGEQSLEIERTYDADDLTPFPDWRRLPGVTGVGEPEPRSLDAQYFDSTDSALARAAVAVRRRTGGPDEGWHIKRATPDGKHETRWPLDVGGEDPSIVPAVVLDAVSALLGGAVTSLTPIARIRNERTAWALTGEDGRLIAEVVDDRVVAEDLRRGARSTWREWEVELGPAAPADAVGRAALFSAADDLALTAGARVSASDSKLARALGV